MAVKFLLSSLFAACWTGAAVGISQPWIDDLSRSVGEPATWVMVTLVAYLPGFVVALMTMSLILDRQPPPRICNPVSPITIIVAARNEQSGIADTIRCIGERGQVQRPEHRTREGRDTLRHCRRRVHRCPGDRSAFPAPAGARGARPSRGAARGAAVAAEAPLAGLISGIVYLIPLLGVGYALIWLPGLVLFLFGVPAIVSAWALTVLPVTLLIYVGLRRHQRRSVFAPLALQVRRSAVGYLAFLLGYQMLCSFASLAGYAQCLAGTARSWKKPVATQPADRA